MNKRHARLERIKAMEREYRVARMALDTLQETSRTDPALLRRVGLNSADVRNTSDHLEATYLVSLFAEFEAGLRDLWENYYRETTVPRTRDLLVSVAADRTMPQDDLDDAQAVREYRNSIVHEGGEGADPIPLERARSILCKYFKWVPLDW